jgi:hypothetical protein
MFLSQDEIKQKIVDMIQQFNEETSEEGLLRFYNEHVIEGTEEPLSSEEFQDYLIALYIDNRITWNKYGLLTVVTSI